MTTTPIERMPPCDVEAEEAAIGSLLIDPQAINSVSHLIGPTDFYIVKNRWIFDAVCDMNRRHQPIDFIMLVNELEARGQLIEVGGAAYISHLLNVVPTALHAAGYAEIVADMSARRLMLTTASTLAIDAYALERDIDEARAVGIESLKNIRPDSQQLKPIGRVAVELLNEIESYVDNPLDANDFRGGKTYIRELDQLLGGYDDDSFTVLAARPGVGKTALMLQMAVEKSMRGERGAIFSFEMPHKRIVRRMAVRRSRIEWESVKRGRVTGDELARLIHEVGIIGDLPLHVVDYRMNTAQIEAEVARVQPDFVIVDNINIIKADAISKNDTRAQQVGRISRSLLDIARGSGGRGCKVPLFVICHMNRGIEARAEKVPTLADLKESGDIEQNADNVIFMYPDETNDKVMYLDPAKMRDGDSTKRRMIGFDRAHQDFKSLERHEFNL